MVWSFMVVAVFAALVSWSAATPEDFNGEGPESLLSNIENGEGRKPFNLHGASGQKRAHGIYFNGR